MLTKGSHFTRPYRFFDNVSTNNVDTALEEENFFYLQTGPLRKECKGLQRTQKFLEGPGCCLRPKILLSQTQIDFCPSELPTSDSD